MPLFEMEFWEVILNGTAFCMCVATVMYLVMIRLGALLRRVRGKRGAPVGTFGDEMCTQMKNHRPAQGSVPFSEGMPDHQDLPGADRGLDATDGFFKEPGQDLPCEGAPRASSHEDLDPYEEVYRLADMGLSLQEIFRAVDISRGEIELMVKLRQEWPWAPGPRERGPRDQFRPVNGVPVN
jgi:hypothetical protein